MQNCQLCTQLIQNSAQLTTANGCIIQADPRQNLLHSTDKSISQENAKQYKQLKWIE